MKYSKYIIFCFIGAVLWVTSITLGGYFLGSNAWIQANFEKVVFGIILVSLVPVAIEFVKHKRASN
jgi:membrane-associated protein